MDRIQKKIIYICAFDPPMQGHNCTATIHINKKMPDFAKDKSLSEKQKTLNCEEYMQNEAQYLFDTLKGTLPRGTIWRLFSLMQKDYEEGQCQG